MNEKTEVKDSSVNEDTFLSSFLTFLEYALNKFMPTICVAFISFYSLGFLTWEPYFIVALMLFSNNFNFKCGYVHSELDKTNGWEDE
jgi:hypothetical protein|tara:strand:+ start:480 stop:740 length:261 start_codon:yes stop_codon:yes gene_type:complete